MGDSGGAELHEAGPVPPGAVDAARGDAEPRGAGSADGAPGHQGADRCHRQGYQGERGFRDGRHRAPVEDAGRLRPGHPQEHHRVPQDPEARHLRQGEAHRADVRGHNRIHRPRHADHHPLAVQRGHSEGRGQGGPRHSQQVLRQHVAGRRERHQRDHGLFRRRDAGPAGRGADEDPGLGEKPRRRGQDSRPRRQFAGGLPHRRGGAVLRRRAPQEVREAFRPGQSRGARRAHPGAGGAGQTVHRRRHQYVQPGPAAGKPAVPGIRLFRESRRRADLAVPGRGLLRPAARGRGRGRLREVRGPLRRPGRH